MGLKNDDLAGKSKHYQNLRYNETAKKHLSGKQVGEDWAHYE